MNPLNNGQLALALAGKLGEKIVAVDEAADLPPKPNFTPPGRIVPRLRPPKEASLLRTEFNYLMYAMAPKGDFSMHRSEEGRVRIHLSPRGETLLRKWRGASSQERRTATEKLDAQAREWRLKQAGLQLPGEKQLILPPGAKQ